MPPPAPPLPAPRLIAILAADAVGYTRLMAIDDRLTVELLDAARAVFRVACEEQQGRVVDMAGDSVLLAFDSAAAPLRCALAVQPRLAAQASIEAGTLRLPFRIGLHLGDVIEKADGSVYGDGVNLAARLQALAEPDEVMVSQALRDLTGARALARFEDAGEHRLKNVAEPMRAWRALPPGAEPATAGVLPLPVDSLRFASRFELQVRGRLLLVDGEPASLRGRAFDLLVELARTPNTLRTKNELLEAIWPGLVVEESSLATHIGKLRKIVGGDVIVTIPGRGYRFTAQLEGGLAAYSPAEPAPAPQAVPAPASPEPAKLQTNLPARLPHLVGRSEDLAALDELIGRHPLVSIIGAGGMGKTIVALHLTSRRQNTHRHGVCWVELANVTDPDALPAAIGAALGVNIGSGEPVAGLCGALMPLTILVTLDNAEQVVDGVANVVQAVLEKAPGVRFVVTTQAPLKLASELVYRIGPLAVPPGPLPAAKAMHFSAVALFADRAHLADARFALTDANVQPVIELCRQLDGVALAIELAAARAPMLGVQRLAASMGDRLRLLTSGRNRVAPARQQTLRAALEWSHGFLEPAERKVFRRLAVFAGSGSLSMVQQVVADPQGDGGLDEWAVLDALALLVDRSRVVAITPDDAAEPRYRLLDTPKLFAREKVQQAGEEAELRRRHALAVAARFDAAYEDLDSDPVRIDPWRQAMEAELDNGREALEWSLSADDVVRAMQIATCLLRVLPKSVYRERLTLVDAMAPLIDSIDDQELLARLGSAIYMYSGAPKVQRSLPLLRRLAARVPPLQASGLVPSRWARHQVQAFLAAAAASAGQTIEAGAALAAARQLADPDWPAFRQFFVLEAEAQLARARGDAAANLRLTLRQIEINAAAGISSATAVANLVDAELAAGHAEQAAATGATLVASLAGGRDGRTLAYARLNLAAAMLVLDRTAEARPHLRAGWVQAPMYDMQPYFADFLALLAALDGRFEPAGRIAGFADAANAPLGERDSIEAAVIARAKALACTALGDASFARLHAEGSRLRDADIEALAFGTEDGR